MTLMALKKTHVIPETCSELSALPGLSAGTPCFPPLSRFRRPFPATLGGNLRAAIRKDVQDTGKTTIDEQKCDDYG